MLPKTVNILGVKYTIKYVSTPIKVDIYNEEELWGQIDYTTRSIRVLDNGRPVEDVFQVLLHEVLHGVTEALHLKLAEEKMHDELDVLALALADVMFRNKWVHFCGKAQRRRSQAAPSKASVEATS